MKILHITNCLRGGGIQNFLLSLLSEQVKLGYDVALIVIEKDDYEYSLHLENILKKSGVRIYRLKKKRSSKFSFLKTLFACRKVTQAYCPNIVNTHGEMSHIYGAFATMMSSMPHCITVHNAPEYWDRINKILNSNKPLIYCSDSAYELRTQKNKDIIAINNGISSSISKSESTVDLRKELNLLLTDKIIVSVGSLRPQKNYDFLKDIVDELKDSSVHFCICGGNYGSGYINIELFKNYPTIHFLGLRSDVAAIQNASDVFLSCATFEGLPIAVLEAFLNGIPCVLSPIVQHQKIAEDVASCIIPKEFTAKAFVDALETVLLDTQSHKAISEQRIFCINKFSIAHTAKQYIEFYMRFVR